MSVMVRPVYTPIRWPKWSLMTAGISTLPTAMPAPDSTVPAKSATGQGAARTAAPSARSITAACTAAGLPSRRDRRGASQAKAPRHSTGNVASTPTWVADRASARWTSPMSGGIPVMAARRLMASRIRPTTSHSLVVTCVPPLFPRGRDGGPLLRPGGGRRAFGVRCGVERCGALRCGVVSSGQMLTLWLTGHFARPAARNATPVAPAVAGVPSCLRISSDSRSSLPFRASATLASETNTSSAAMLS